MQHFLYFLPLPQAQGSFRPILALWPVKADHQNESRDEATSIDQRIAAVLAEAQQPRTFADLRASCRVRAKTLYQCLAAMTAAGSITKSPSRYSLAAR